MQHSSKATEVDDVTEGSGNVFADLGYQMRIRSKPRLG